MEKTYIQLYDRNERSIKLLMVLSILLFLVGLIGLINSFMKTNMVWFELNKWHNLFLFIQGLAMFFVLNNALKAKRFFISWSDDKINYHFPKNKESEIITIEEIHSMQINTSEIKIHMKNNEIKKINLNLVFLPKRT